MSRTKRQEPRNGQFKNLKASINTKKQRTKKQRSTKASLSKYVGLSNNFIIPLTENTNEIR